MDEPNGRMEDTEARISELEDKTVEIIQSEQKRKKYAEKSLLGLQGPIGLLKTKRKQNKNPDICIIRVLEREEKRAGMKEHAKIY